ncbi:hypothetical protein D9602_00055 [Sphingomonas sp. TX0522]|nr:hypothetical protein [Sphingomonas sp. TX0522]
MSQERVNFIGRSVLIVIPAKAGIHGRGRPWGGRAVSLCPAPYPWIPACAGMTDTSAELYAAPTPPDSVGTSRLEKP